MSRPNQLLFDGHLATEIAPCVFKLEEPCDFDAEAWHEANMGSGDTVYYKNGKLYYVITSGAPEGIYSLCRHGVIPNLDSFDAIKTLSNVGFPGRFLP